MQRKNVTIEWQNVTEKLQSACNFLKTGELVKDQHFGLFEAMSAIEMMDPKMDAGMKSNLSESNIKSFTQAVNDSLIKTDAFTSEEKIAIVDNTLCNFITWLDGASLAQTLFTNLYLHNPALITDTYMKYFSIAILRVADWMRNKILTGCVFEEEDFQLMNYNFNFMNDVPSNELLNSLKSVEDNSAKLYRHLKGNSTIANDEANRNSEVELSNSLLIRIKFIRYFFQIMCYFEENSSIVRNIDDVNKHITICLELLPKLYESHTNQMKLNQLRSEKSILIGFEPTINQRLLPPTFPRFIKIHSYESTINEYQKILTQLKKAITTTELNTFQQIFDFASQFSNQDHSILIRSIVQLLLLPRIPVDKIFKLKGILFESVQKFVSPPVLNIRFPLANKDICLQLVDNFLNKCAPVFANLVQVLGHNKPRQREKFGQIFEDFAYLQEDADNLDRISQSFFIQQKNQINNLPYFGSWILFNNLNIMNLFLLSGFELDLYSKFEYYYIYWYLCEIILNWQINTLQRVDKLLFDNTKLIKKSKKKTKSFYEKELDILIAKRHMFSAYYQVMKIFSIQENILFPNNRFDCEEFRFDHRFDSFKFFKSPQLCSYNYFKEKDELFSRSLTIQKIYSLAQENFDAARNIFGKYIEYQNISITAKKNFVVIRLLSSGLKKIQKLDLNFDENAFFPIINI